MKNIVLLSLLSLAVFCSCSTTKPRGGYTYVFDNSYTGLDTLINIDGYYASKVGCGERSTLHSMIMFYSNGLLMMANTDIPKELSFCFETNDNSESCQFPSWGTYQIIGDTIRTQIINNLGSLYGNLTSFKDYKILQTKEIVNVGNYCDSKKDKGCNGYKNNPCPIIAEFYPLESKRDYKTCPWLKKKWFNEKSK